MSATAPVDPDFRTRRSLITPEGVDLRPQIAEAGQRAAAFLLDAGLMGAILIALTLLCFFALLAAKLKAAEPIAVIWLLGFFLLRNFWFVGFELSGRAATPGKRLMKLRVARRDGARLTADVIFARNAMREIEVFLPLTFLISNAGGIDAWTVLLGLIWTGVFALFPLFNRDHLRLGDLVAGTWVVRAPQKRLARDLTDERASPVMARFVFTSAQLDAYGVKELQVLEQVLRTNNRSTVRAVAERIRRKIGWFAAPDESDQAFLEAYYAALRARLESRLLLGRRRRDKFEAP